MNKKLQLIPVMLCFFAMGFVDLVGIASNYVQQDLLAVPEKQNEVSGLMIMGLFGGTVFPLLMGFASDAIGQAGAIAVMAVGVVYLFTYLNKVGK
jgi:fucose permease